MSEIDFKYEGFVRAKWMRWWELAWRWLFGDLFFANPSSEDPTLHTHYESVEIQHPEF